ncbi:MAG: flagellar FlbD family protein [Chlamydiia bacterium]|nr:flagellar FlbD family protein [Chlamydiia bacterium]
MFNLTKFTGETFWVNPEAIKTVEEAGDTVLTLMTGERILVKESAEEIREQFIAYKRAVFHDGPFSAPRLLAQSAR